MEAERVRLSNHAAPPSARAAETIPSEEAVPWPHPHNRAVDSLEYATPHRARGHPHVPTLEVAGGRVKLGINGWRLRGKRTGVARYLYNVIKHWTPELVAGRFDEITLYTPEPIDRRELPLPPNIQERVLRPNWPMLIWENLRLAPAATDDILFCPSYSIPLMARSRTVVATHEATAALHPDMYPRSARYLYVPLYRWSARHATRVVTHTEAGRRDIARCYKVDAAKIRVTYPAPAEIFKAIPGHPQVREMHRRYLGSDAPFFLYVGSLTTRRNTPKLMQAFAEMKRGTGVPHKLLIVGLNTTGLDLPAMAKDLHITDDFRHVEYMPDADLNFIYNAAEAFVMPYTYESVSLPVLEAQTVGTPVIMTDTPGLDELTCGTALLIKEAEVPDIAEAMTRLATDQSLRQELSEKGMAHATRFSWKQTASETLGVLHEAAAEGAPRVLHR